ncbi:hypothetical protein LTR66_002099 [Elasticomyces elasticus]|nr:hypothetical protein LTR66_002099 [Elasticomyces elasticus]
MSTERVYVEQMPPDNTGNDSFGAEEETQSAATCPAAEEADITIGYIDDRVSSAQYAHKSLLSPLAPVFSLSPAPRRRHMIPGFYAAPQLEQCDPMMNENILTNRPDPPFPHQQHARDPVALDTGKLSDASYISFRDSPTITVDKAAAGGSVAGPSSGYATMSAALPSTNFEAYMARNKGRGTMIDGQAGDTDETIAIRTAAASSGQASSAYACDTRDLYQNTVSAGLGIDGLDGMVLGSNHDRHIQPLIETGPGVIGDGRRAGRGQAHNGGLFTTTQPKAVTAPLPSREFLSGNARSAGRVPHRIMQPVQRIKHQTSKTFEDEAEIHPGTIGLLTNTASIAEANSLAAEASAVATNLTPSNPVYAGQPVPTPPSAHYTETFPELIGQSAPVWEEKRHNRAHQVRIHSGEQFMEAFEGALEVLSSMNPGYFQLPFGSKVINIKTDSEANVVTSLRNGVWSCPGPVNARVVKVWENRQSTKEQVLLLFSVSGSKQFCGIAEMRGPLDVDRVTDGWQNGQLKKGAIPLLWKYCKTVSFTHFHHLRQINGGDCVTNMWNGMQFPEAIGRMVVKTYVEAPHVENMLVRYQVNQTRSIGRYRGRNNGYGDRRSFANRIGTRNNFTERRDFSRQRLGEGGDWDFRTLRSTPFHQHMGALAADRGAIGALPAFPNQNCTSSMQAHHFERGGPRSATAAFSGMDHMVHPVRSSAMAFAPPSTDQVRTGPPPHDPMIENAMRSMQIGQHSSRTGIPPGRVIGAKGYTHHLSLATTTDTGNSNARALTHRSSVRGLPRIIKPATSSPALGRSLETDKSWAGRSIQILHKSRSFGQTFTHGNSAYTQTVGSPIQRFRVPGLTEEEKEELKLLAQHKEMIEKRMATLQSQELPDETSAANTSEDHTTLSEAISPSKDEHVAQGQPSQHSSNHRRKQSGFARFDRQIEELLESPVQGNTQPASMAPQGGVSLPDPGQVRQGPQPKD